MLYSEMQLRMPMYKVVLYKPYRNGSPKKVFPGQFCQKDSKYRKYDQRLLG